LRRSIQRLLEDALAEQVLQGNFKDGDTIMTSLDGEVMKFEKSEKKADTTPAKKQKADKEKAEAEKAEKDKADKEKDKADKPAKTDEKPSEEATATK
jgi:hypothetical protein